MAYHQSQYQRMGFENEQWPPYGAPLEDFLLTLGGGPFDYLQWLPDFSVGVDGSAYPMMPMPMPVPMPMPMPMPMPPPDDDAYRIDFGPPFVPPQPQPQHQLQHGLMDGGMGRGGSSSDSSAGGDTPPSGGSTQMGATRSNSVESFGSASDGPAVHPPRQPLLQATTAPEVAIAVRMHSRAAPHSYPHSHKRRLASSPSSPSSSSRGSISSTSATASPAPKSTRAVGELGPRDGGRRIRKKFSHDQKIETHMTRLEGACLRCWKNRKRCVKAGGACCRYCSTLLDPMPDIPCFRSRLSSSELFRQGPTDEFRWTKRKWLQTASNDTKVWRSPQTRLLVTQGLGLQLELVVKQYEPQPDDQDSYTWTDRTTGAVKSLTMPRYAVANISAAQDAIDRYVSDYTEAYIAKKIGSHDTIPWKTFRMALRMSDEGSSLVRNALRLWTASRVLEDPWEITGSETLGMQRDGDPASPYYGKVPVTPVMDFQIDNITVCKILMPLRKQILQELQKKVLENRRKDFLEIFLTMYILLHNIELTIAHDRWFAQRWNCKLRFSHYALIDSVFAGANIMLAHFHHVTRGYAPFALDLSKCPADRPNETHKRFMAEISAAAKHQAASLRVLRETAQYESPMFWCSQLFYEGWKPVPSPPQCV